MITAEAKHLKPFELVDITPVAALTAGTVIQLPDGRAAGCPSDIAAGEKGSVQVSGLFECLRTASIVTLDGQPLFWDYSANKAYIVDGSDRDFFLGCAHGDTASSATKVKVWLNQKPVYKINLQESNFETAIVKTVVGSTTVEVPDVKMRGGAAYMLFGATAEAQKVDLLSKLSWAIDTPWIFEGIINVVDDGDASAIDFSFGVANATHASDADTITESALFHLDGNALDLFAESDDGTNEIAATDTTVNIALGTPVHLMIDGRDKTALKYYVDGVAVLTSTAFKLTVAAGPLKMLAHLEKSSDDTTADYRIVKMGVRTMDNIAAA